MLIVDMKMPKSCDECPISNGFKIPCPYGIDDGAGYDMFQAYKVGKRPSWCPIKGELVRCGECKHGITGHGITDGWVLCSKPYATDTVGGAMHRCDWFCADGERTHG